jgi:NAD(P)-dependent dehydrogenase (short-subunit alcohol dehydrogenase family)
MARTYVVTGSGSGIGAATAELLDAQGHRVIGVDLRDAEVCVDLASTEGRAQLVEQVGEMSGGRIDAVVACAGTVSRGHTDVRVNYFGAVATLEGLRPLLVRGAEPRAVAVASYAVLGAVDADLVDACLGGHEQRAVEAVPADPMVVYGSTKRALARWVRAAAPTPAWAGAGVALNAVGPGIVRTPMTEPLLGDPGIAQLLLAAVPMPFGGIAEPGAIATVLAFLTSAELRSLTGQLIFVDGGGDCVQRGDDIWS